MSNNKPLIIRSFITLLVFIFCLGWTLDIQIVRSVLSGFESTAFNTFIYFIFILSLLFLIHSVLKILNSLEEKDGIEKKKIVNEVALFNESTAEEPVVTNTEQSSQLSVVGEKQISSIAESVQDIQKSNAHFFQIFDVNPIGMAITDVNGVYTHLNESFLSSFGFTKEEMIGKTSLDLNLVSAEHREKTKAELLKKGFVKDSEVEVRRKNGEKFYALTSVQTIEIGDEKFTLSSLHDISQRKEMERQLEIAKREAEESNVVKDTFLANMSHEIRTPMNAIVGFTKLLSDRVSDGVEKEYLQIIQNAGDNLLGIINDILDLSKLEAGQITIENRFFNIKEVFGSINDLMSQKAQEKNLHISFEYDERISPYLIGDPLRITQIFINLVSNAIKFTDQGSVIITANYLEARDDKDWLIFNVIDTGIGIEADKQHLVFDRFRQAESHIGWKYGGTGLGLSIAKKLIELMNGTITLSSKLNAGTTFTVKLPFKKFRKASIPPKSKKVIKTQDLSGTRLLVAEDNPVNVKLIQIILSSFNIIPDIAWNGKEAIDKLVLNPYDMVLMDIQMPFLDGYETTAFIRNQLKMDIPIIAITAHALTGEREKCLKAGINDYLSKPYDSDELYDKMSKLLRVSVSN